MTALASHYVFGDREHVALSVIPCLYENGRLRPNLAAKLKDLDERLERCKPQRRSSEATPNGATGGR